MSASSDCGTTPCADQSKGGEEVIPGEICAAISMALLELDNEVHDIENTILTISRTQRPYSPWSSKIYSMNKTPNFIPNRRS